MSQSVRILNAEQVKQCLPMDHAILAMRSAFGQLAAGRAMIPLRTHLDLKSSENTTLVMPSYLDDNRQVGVKLLSLCEKYRDRGLPFIQAVVMVMDAETGQLRAMMDGTSLTAIRTGAVSGLATQFLAREDAARAVIFGAGAQARTQLEAIVTARPTIRHAAVYDPLDTAAADFARTMSDQLGIEVTASNDRAALGQADVICTATPSPEPLFSPDELKQGVHINAVGSYRLDMHEIPEDYVVRAKVVTDDTESCLSETADLILPIRNGRMTRDDIHAELGDLVLGNKPGRTDATENTLFKSVGLAIQDLAAASAVLELAEQESLGIVAEL